MSRCQDELGLMNLWVCDVVVGLFPEALYLSAEIDSPEPDDDWELGQYYWQCYSKATELGVARRVRRRYEDLINIKRLQFFVGTTRNHHDIALNPFVIVGAFNLPVIFPT